MQKHINIGVLFAFHSFLVFFFCHLFCLDAIFGTEYESGGLTCGRSLWSEWQTYSMCVCLCGSVETC